MICFLNYIKFSAIQTDIWYVHTNVWHWLNVYRWIGWMSCLLAVCSHSLACLACLVYLLLLLLQVIVIIIVVVVLIGVYYIYFVFVFFFVSLVHWLSDFGWLAGWLTGSLVECLSKRLQCVSELWTLITVTCYNQHLLKASQPASHTLRHAVTHSYKYTHINALSEIRYSCRVFL